jgi:hypothetical protein
LLCESFTTDWQKTLVTGAARTLGFDMTIALPEAGCDVPVTSQGMENACASAERIATETGRK